METGALGRAKKAFSHRLELFKQLLGGERELDKLLFVHHALDEVLKLYPLHPASVPPGGHGSIGASRVEQSLTNNNDQTGVIKAHIVNERHGIAVASWSTSTRALESGYNRNKASPYSRTKKPKHIWTRAKNTRFRCREVLLLLFKHRFAGSHGEGNQPDASDRGKQERSLSHYTRSVSSASPCLSSSRSMLLHRRHTFVLPAPRV